MEKLPHLKLHYHLRKAMYVLTDIIILIYHQEAWSRLAKESSIPTGKENSIPTEPRVGKRNTERKRRADAKLNSGSHDLQKKNQHPTFSSNSKDILQPQMLIF